MPKLAELFEYGESVKECLHCHVAKSRLEMKTNNSAKGGYGHVCRVCQSRMLGHKPFTVPQLAFSESQLAYLAGIIDGEGYVGICRNKYRIGKLGYMAQISIGMTGQELVELHREYGIGGLYIRRKRLTKDLYVWRMGSYACRCILPQVIPYLRFKRRQAKLVLCYLRMTKQRTIGRLPYMEKAARIYWRLRLLNKRRRVSGS